jgi:hypothetical protein
VSALVVLFALAAPNISDRIRDYQQKQKRITAGVIGYYMGYVRGRKKKVESEKL